MEERFDHVDNNQTLKSEKKFEINTVLIILDANDGLIFIGASRPRIPKQKTNVTVVAKITVTIGEKLSWSGF